MSAFLDALDTVLSTVGISDPAAQAMVLWFAMIAIPCMFVRSETGDNSSSQARQPATDD